MDSLREIFDAMNSRIRSPIFGSIAVMFIIFNWKPLFYLAFAHKPAEEKFQFFDANVTLISGLVAPIALGVLFAIASPWIALFSAWLAEAPTTRRKLRQTKSTDKILTEKLRLDQTRNQLLASEERALIDAAKRDEEVKEIEDPEIRDELKREIEQLRIASSNAEANLSNFISNNATTERELSKYQRNMGQIQELLAALERTQFELKDMNEIRETTLRANDSTDTELIDDAIEEVRRRQVEIIRTLHRITSVP